MLTNLFVKLWKDECGAIVSAEYLLLGTVVGVGGVTGMAAMRDSVAEEFREYGQSVREVRQAYTVNAMSGGAAKTAGSTFSDNRPAVTSMTSSNPAQYPSF